METSKEIPPGFAVVEEGKARILFPEANVVFYNPVQEQVILAVDS